MNARTSNYRHMIVERARSVTTMEEALCKLIVQLQALLAAPPEIGIAERLQLINAKSSLLAVFIVIESNLLIGAQLQDEQKKENEHTDYISAIDHWVASICNELEEALKVGLHCSERHLGQLHALVIKLLLQLSQFRTVVAQRQRNTEQRALIEHVAAIQAIERLWSSFKQRHFQSAEAKLKGEKALFRLLQLCYRRQADDKPVKLTAPWLSTPVKLRESKHSLFNIQIK